jgi:hypothetical protein
LGNIQYIRGKFFSHLQIKITTKTLDDTVSELAFRFDIIHVRQSVIDGTNFGCFDNELILLLQGPFKGLVENVLKPIS